MRRRQIQSNNDLFCQFIPMWYYFIAEKLFPLFFLASIWFFKKKKPYAILVGLCIAYIILSLAMRTQIYLTDHPHWDTVMRKSLLTRLDCSVYGVLMALFFFTNSTASLICPKPRCDKISNLYKPTSSASNMLN